MKENMNLTEWPGRDVFSDGLPVMGCIRAAEIIPMELKSKIEMLVNSDLYNPSSEVKSFTVKKSMYFPELSCEFINPEVKK